jgi:hypothetical protein
VDKALTKMQLLSNLASSLFEVVNYPLSNSITTSREKTRYGCTKVEDELLKCWIFDLRERYMHDNDLLNQELLELLKIKP